MKLLYVSGLYMPASGGAELSMFTLLKSLALIGIEIIVITKGDPFETYSYDKSHSNIRVIRINNRGLLNETLEYVYKNNSEISAVLTQNAWADIVVNFANKSNIPIIYFVRGPFGGINVSEEGEFKCNFIVANSQATKNYFENKFSRKDIIVVPPLIEKQDYLIDSNSHEFITIINPIVIKGGKIFKNIASRMIDRKFLAVKGWSHLKKNDEWDISLLKDLSENINLSNFAEVNFKDTPNITLMNSVEDMKNIYSKTNLLIVPSVIHEGGPRVVFEAMLNGIPVVGSNSGNIASAIKNGGIVIEDIYDIEKWIDEIKKFDDANYYNEISLCAKDKASDFFDINKQIKPLIEILKFLKSKK